MSDSASPQPGDTTLDRVLASLDRMHRDMGDMRQAIGALTEKVSRHDDCHNEVRKVRDECRDEVRKLQESTSDEVRKLRDEANAEVKKLREDADKKARELDEKILVRERSENTEKLANAKLLADANLNHTTEITKIKTTVALMSALIGGSVVVIVEVVKMLVGH